MTFSIPVRKTKTKRDVFPEEERVDDFNISDAYRETLSKIYGNHLPEVTEKKSRVFQFSSHEKEEDGYIELNRVQMAMIKGETFKGNWFIYLITLPPSVSSKTDSHVGWTTNPLVDLYLLNKGCVIYKHIDRNIAMAIPHWKLDRVIGTLTCEEQAIYFAHMWVYGTRGKGSKRDKAPFLSEASDSNLFSFEEHLGEYESMENLLNSIYISQDMRSTLLEELELQRKD